MRTARIQLSVQRTTGYRYDAAGNLECNPMHPSGSTVPFFAFYTYDADNRMKSAGMSGGSTYSYDPDGHQLSRYIIDKYRRHCADCLLYPCLGVFDIVNNRRRTKQLREFCSGTVIVALVSLLLHVCIKFRAKRGKALFFVPLLVEE